MTETMETRWLEERRLRNVIPQPFSGLLNLALMVVLSTIIYHVVFSPAGYLRLYTPNLGVALVITILMVIHWGMDCFDFWPFNRRFLRETNGLVKGVILLLFYVGIALLVMFVLYNEVIGRLGPIFFSGPALLAGGGLGQYAQTARENACYAQIMMNTCIIFFTILWLTGFGYAPWGKSGKLVRSFSVWIMGMFLAIIAFALLFYPHIAYQFFPAQIFMAASPWWSGWAMTISSFFHFGWMVPALVLLYWTNMFWEGRPFSLIRNTFWRGVATTVVVVIGGIIIMFLSNHIMDWYFETEAFEGGSTIELPAWRWNHVAEMFMYMAAAGAILYYYFDNWPKGLSLPVRAIVRTVIAVAGGLIMAWLYYALGPTFLGNVPGMAMENDTSLCWTVMLLSLVIAHGVFFDGFPFKKRE
jgi:amino acid transporter, AAT family